MVNLNKTTNTNNIKSHNYIAYYFSLIFILPILVCLITNTVIYTGGFVVTFSLIFFIYALLFKRDILFDPDKINLSGTAISIFFIAQLAGITYSVVSRFYAFDVSGIDGSIFDGLVQNILLGNIGYSSIVGAYHFAIHQNYILFLLAPFYGIFNSQVYLQVICGLSFWFAGVVLWKIVNQYFGKLVSLLTVVCFYTLPSNEFHMFQPEIFYPLAICLLYHAACINTPALKNVSTKISWLCFILATLFLLSIKEDGAWFGLGFSLFLLTRKEYKKAIFLLLISLLFINVNLFIVQPFFLAKNHVSESGALGFWSNLGSTKQEIIHNLITNPLNILSSIFEENSGFWFLYGYWLFLPLFNWFSLLVGIIELIAFCLANPDSHLHLLSAYYALPLTTIVLIGFILFMHKVLDQVNNKKYFNIKWINFILVVLILFHNIFYVRIKDTVAAMSGRSIPEQLYIVQMMPLSIGMWQSFYPVNGQNLDDFNKMYDEIKLRYLNDNICPSNILYPHFSALTFKNLHKWGDGSFNVPNCVNVFASMNGPWPNSPQDQINKMNTVLNSGNECRKFGNYFYYCVVK
jgi:uncharacterized membrane protein